MSDDLFPTLRELLSAPFHYERLFELYDLFDRWPKDQAIDIAKQYAREHMETWGLTGEKTPICLLDLQQTSWGTHPANSLLAEADEGIVIASSDFQRHTDESQIIRIASDDQIQYFDGNHTLRWQQPLEAPLVAVEVVDDVVHGVDKRGFHLRWSLGSGELLEAIKRVPTKPLFGALAPSCQWVAVAYPILDGPQVSLWDLSEGKEVCKSYLYGIWNKEDTFIDDITFASDSSAFVVLGEVQGSVTSYGQHWQWEYLHSFAANATATGEQMYCEELDRVREYDYGVGGYVYYPGSCTFSPDKRWIISYKEETLYITPSQEPQQPQNWNQLDSCSNIIPRDTSAVDQGLILAAASGGDIALFQLHHWMEHVLTAQDPPAPPSLDLSLQGKVTKMQWSPRVNRLWVWSQCDSTSEEEESLHSWELL